MKKKLKIEWADSLVIEALDDYVFMTLNIIANVMVNSNIADAFVSDESKVIDFLNWDESDEEKLLEISDGLGVPVDSSSYIYEVAVALRDKD